MGIGPYERVTIGLSDLHIRDKQMHICKKERVIYKSGVQATWLHPSTTVVAPDLPSLAAYM